MDTAVVEVRERSSELWIVNMNEEDVFICRIITVYTRPVSPL
jgi:hypothetical protein